MTKPVARTVVNAWAQQIEADAMKWAEGRGNHERAALEAYRAGLQRGCRDMIATLELQGCLEVQHG